MTVQARAIKKGTNIFQEVMDAAARTGRIPDKSQESTAWMKKYIRKNVYRVQPFHGAKQSAVKNRPTIGKMYLFQYEAVTEGLPYWDAFPLTLFFNEDAEHYWGFNFHYAPLQYRVVILNALYDILGNKALSDKAKIAHSYQFLKRIVNFKFLAPCVKCYLKSQVQSRFLEIPSTDWQIAMFLPVARWQVASQQKVHADYKRKV